MAAWALGLSLGNGPAGSRESFKGPLTRDSSPAVDDSAGSPLTAPSLPLGAEGGEASSKRADSCPGSAPRSDGRTRRPEGFNSLPPRGGTVPADAAETLRFASIPALASEWPPESLQIAPEGRVTGLSPKIALNAPAGFSRGSASLPALGPHIVLSDVISIPSPLRIPSFSLVPRAF